MKLDVAEFRSFCNDLKIDAKEYGVVSLGEVWSGTQQYFIEELAEGLARGVHFFVVLKGRQVHITTVCLALDLYWSCKFSGVQGTLITDTEENRDMFRETLTLYLESLPNKWKQKLIRHNRTQLILANRSRFFYQVAGTKKKEKRSVGVGKAVMMAHGTECSNWGDDGALPDIGASLAKQNPRRLYVWESTARGPNGFEMMCEIAQQSTNQKFIFVGWWRNSLYLCKKESSEYQVYWDGHMTSEEASWVEEVKRLYDYEITDEHLAWWRYTLAEEQFDLQKMYENYPPTETYAFQMSGSQFFQAASLMDRLKIARAKPFDAMRFVLGPAFEDTEIVPADPQTATYRMWETPKSGAYYAIGGDPAYGSSEWADRFCVQVYRCYADGMDQVAEFCTDQCSTYQFAWVMLYLAGAYFPSMINLEINGPGMAVWAEMQKMKQLAGSYSPGINANIFNVIANVQNYLYRRPDSIGGGFNYHWKTDTNSKHRMMNGLKDGFERGLIVVNSREMFSEMKNIVIADGDIGAPGRGKDDRVIASALAAVAWSDFIRLRMAASGMTRSAAARTGVEGAKQPLARSVSNYLKAMKIEPPAGSVRH